jgi:predicted membrane channel-forming protein YqfA (hemolysin III family)
MVSNRLLDVQYHFPPVLPYVWWYALAYLDYYKLFSRFDYAGINILISGSAFPPIYYGMYCNLNLTIFYLTLIAIMAVCLFTICLFEWIHK